MKTFKQMYYEGEQTRQTNDAQRREKEALMRRHKQQDQQAKAIDTRKKEQDKRDRERQMAQRKRERERTQTENAPSLAVLKKKIKSGTKLGSTETASAKARGLIPRADGTKRKSDKYK